MPRSSVYLPSHLIRSNTAVDLKRPLSKQSKPEISNVFLLLLNIRTKSLCKVCAIPQTSVMNFIRRVSWEKHLTLLRRSYYLYYIIIMASFSLKSMQNFIFFDKKWSFSPLSQAAGIFCPSFTKNISAVYCAWAGGCSLLPKWPFSVKTVFFFFHFSWCPSPNHKWKWPKKVISEHLTNIFFFSI